VATDNGNQVFEHIFEGNNLDVRRGEDTQPKPTNVTMTPPDLEVDYVNAPANAQASHPMTFTYQVTNYGVAATPNSSWADAYYLSADATLDAGDLYLGRLTHYGALDVSGAANDSYTRTATYALPNGLTGDFYVLVKTDSSNVVFEGPAGSKGESNNVKASAGRVHVVSNPPDLVIVPGSFEPWATAQAGSFLRATWGVLNQGTGSTVGGTWTCKVYASLDNTKGGADDRLLATFVRNGDLAAEGFYYAIDRQINIPIDLSGTIYLYVRTDADNQVYEGANENNNDSGLVPVTIVQHLADLQVTALDPIAGPIRAGDWVTVRWTVQNLGTGRTNALRWRDRIYLSPDNVLGNGNDTHLSSLTRTSPLEAGESYAASASVRIPAGVSGPFYLGVWADADGSVFEGALENNNARLRGLGVDPDDPDDPGPIEPPPPGTVLVPDLVLVSVDAPPEAYSGQAFSLSWTVRNDGDPTPRGWYDQVYLSLDQIYDPGTDISLGHVSHASLGSSQSYTETRSFSIPRGLSGPFYVFAVADRGSYLNESNELNNANYDRTSMLVNLVPPADLVVGVITVPANASPGVNATITYTVDNRDIRNQIPESDETNNIAASLDRAAVDAQSLELGVPGLGTLSRGQSLYYKVQVPAGETLLVTFDSGAEEAFTELYVSFEQMPNRTRSDFAAIEPFQPDQRVVVPLTQEGTYYLLVYGNQSGGVSDPHSILAQRIDFSVFDTSYGRGGNAGDLTIEIKGAKFDRTVTARLANSGGADRPAVEMYYTSSTKTFATFDLRGLAPGPCDVVVENGHGDRVTVTDGLLVVEGGGGNNRPSIQAPRRVRRNRGFEFTVSWGNDGINDILAPLLVVGNTVPFGFRTGDQSAGTRLTFLAVSSDGPPGILRPGQSEQITFYSYSDANPGTYKVYVDRLYEDLQTPFNWEAIRVGLVPPGMSDEDFAPIFAQLVAQVGTTTPSS